MVEIERAIGAGEAVFIQYVPLTRARQIENGLASRNFYPTLFSRPGFLTFGRHGFASAGLSALQLAMPGKRGWSRSKTIVATPAVGRAEA
jgi:hypothetical protein